MNILINNMKHKNVALMCCKKHINSNAQLYTVGLIF